MKSDKALQVFVQLCVALVHLFARVLVSVFSNSTSLYVARYRWQASREAYEQKLANSVGMPGYWRVFTRVHESLGNIFDALLIIVFGSALITTVANQTTGSAAKNGNVTASPGAAAIITLLPFIFVAIIAFAAFDLLRSKHKGM